MVALEEKLSVRPARHSDVAGLSLVWQELMTLHEATDARFALSRDALARWRAMAHDMLGRDDGFLYLAELGGRPVGFCLGWLAKNPPIYKVADVGFISEIAVQSAYQRRGIGRALIDEARRWFYGRGLREFQLSTAVWNTQAQAFWRALGGEPLLLRYRFPLDG